MICTLATWKMSTCIWANHSRIRWKWPYCVYLDASRCIWPIVSALTRCKLLLRDRECTLKDSLTGLLPRIRCLRQLTVFFLWLLSLFNLLLYQFNSNSVKKWSKKRTLTWMKTIMSLCNDRLLHDFMCSISSSLVLPERKHTRRIFYWKKFPHSACMASASRQAENTTSPAWETQIRNLWLNYIRCDGRKLCKCTELNSF